MSELETIIDQLSDAALLEMVDSDPALLVLQAAALAGAAIEARGGKAALQSRLAGAKEMANNGGLDPSGASLPMETGSVPFDDSPAASSPALEPESKLLPAAQEISQAKPPDESMSIPAAKVVDGVSEFPSAVAAPEQPSLEERAPAASSGPELTPSSQANEAETMSAAVIDAILAAAGNAPETGNVSDSGVAASADSDASASPSPEARPQSVDEPGDSPSEPSSSPGPTLQPASAEETASAADIEAILAATGNAPGDAILPPPGGASAGEIADDKTAGISTAAPAAVLSESDASTSTVADGTGANASSADDSVSSTNEESAAPAVQSNLVGLPDCESSRRPPRNSGRTIRTRRVALTMAVLVVLVVVGVLADQRWFRKPAVAVEAREGRTARAVAALETCRALYESTVNATRPRLLQSVATASRRRENDAEESFIQTLGELRLAQASRITELQAAYDHTKTAFAELTQIQGVPPELAVDFEKFSVIMSRHCEFMGTRQPPQAFEQWYNDYERMTAVYRRIRKELTLIEARSGSGSVQSKTAWF